MNKLILFDRIEAIKMINKHYDLEHKAYLSFSGGKDSTILHYLLDLALPNNQIPRVFIDTGIEYTYIKEYVYEMAKNDKRIIIIKPKLPIKQTLEKVGYPFKSKEHSLRVLYFNKGSNANYIKKYITGIDKNGKKTIFKCPKALLYQFEEKGKYNFSNRCCYEMKKNIAYKYSKENNRPITITGMRNEEGGNRRHLSCITNNNTKIHPLIKVNEDWLDWFIKEYNIKLCKLYYPPFNFKRTGCKGCPYNKDLQKQLEIMKELLPNEYKQCQIIWQPVYEEYKRIGYRLK